MYQKLIPYKTTLFIAFIILFISACNVIKKSIDERDGIELALRQEIKMTKDPLTNEVPKDRLITAKSFKDHQLKTRSAISNVSWNELGPNNCGGRTRSIWVDLNDATRKTVWAGSVAGGLWKTTDITASSPTWTPINDLFDNIAITDIVQDPTNTNIMYFGTGEGFGNADRVRGLGIWKSTDGGTNWAQLPSTNNSTFHFTMKMIVTSTGALLVATANNGVQRSTNGGTSFSKVLGTGLGITGASTNNTYDVELASNGHIYASLGGSVHKSTNDGVTFAAAQTLGVTCNRIELACAPNNSSIVYALLESGGAVVGIIYSDDAGANWAIKTEPSDIDPGISATDFSRGQAWYDLTIAVSPSDNQTIYVGGIDLFKSTDAGTSWAQISHWYGGFSLQDVHADQHDIFFSPNSGDTIYFVNDGGVYRTSNGNTAIPTIIQKEDNYNTTQFYACAIHPTAGTNYFLAGSQDNGSHKLTTDAISSSVEVTGGDGAFCHIDQDEPQYQFTSYVYNNFFRSDDGGLSFTGVDHGNSGQFINPSDYDDVNNRMYSARGNGEYLLWSNPQTGNTFTTKTIAAFSSSKVSAVKVSPNNNNRVYFGLENGDIVIVNNANATTPTATSISTGLPNAYLSCIEVETGNENHIVITYSNYGVNSIWESTNGGTSWTSVEGNMPDMPIRWILLNPNNTDQALVATELGVWSTDNLDGASTVWGASNTGLANVRVDMLQTRSSDKLVIAATHGRGLYFSDIFTSPTAKFTSSAQIGYIAKPIQFTNTSYQSTSYLWDFGDGTTSIQENPLKAYTTSGIFNITLTINSGASTITKTNYIQILPNRATPYTIAQGGNFEINPGDFGSSVFNGTAFVRGNSITGGKSGTVSGSNAWVTGLIGNYVDNTTAYLYTPNYNFLATGLYTMKFFTKYQLEDQYDGFLIQYSTDTGSTWNNLGSLVETNWYNIQNNPIVTTIFPFNQAFFTGLTGGAYAQKTKDLTAFANTPTVAFRFVFKTDESTVNSGIAIDNFEIIGPLTNPLPITLTTFNVLSINPDDINIQWETNFEENIETYEVERSTNANDFSKVKTENSQKNNLNMYSVVDKNAWQVASANTLYYRLKIIETSGTSYYSEVKTIKNNTLLNNILITPIPCNQYIHIQTTALIKRITIIDMQGKEILAVKNTTGKIILPSTMIAGTYVITIETNKGSVERKILKR
jgi:PKD repeat protein